MNFPTDIPAISSPSFVLDVAVTAAWAVARHYTLYAHRVQSRLAFGGAAVIATNWPVDLAEELRTAENRGQTTRVRIEALFANLAGYRIYLDERAPHLAWPEVLNLARTHDISVRDAAYLELALRLKLPLASTDATLLRAATAAGVPTFTP